MPSNNHSANSYSSNSYPSYTYFEELGTLKEFYSKHLFRQILPFWLKNGIDRENGGFFTCFNNRGDRLISRNKYVWSQGRFLWLLSHLLLQYQQYKKYFDADTWKTIKQDAARGAEFLCKHAILSDGTCVWLLDEKGTPIIPEEQPGGKYQYETEDARDTAPDAARENAAADDRASDRASDTAGESTENATGGGFSKYHLGIEADHFLLYGLAEYSMAVSDRSFFDLATVLLENIEERTESDKFKSAPYGVPAGYKSHSIYMLLLESLRQMIRAARHFNDKIESRLILAARKAAKHSLEGFLMEKENLLLEMVPLQGKPRLDTLIGSYINPGHSLEHAWFLMELSELLEDGNAGDTKAALEFKRRGIEITRRISDMSWDTPYGGIPQFLHFSGSAPKGEVEKNQMRHSIVKKISEHWDKKLWWVHSEALYALLSAYLLSGEENLFMQLIRLHAYTFKVFPNGKGSVGEWIQIRNREGEPVDEFVALPVKDPFHIARALMLAIEKLENCERRGRNLQ